MIVSRTQCISISCFLLVRQLSRFQEMWMFLSSCFIRFFIIFFQFSGFLVGVVIFEGFVVYFIFSISLIYLSSKDWVQDLYSLLRSPSFELVLGLLTYLLPTLIFLWDRQGTIVMLNSFFYLILRKFDNISYRHKLLTSAFSNLCSFLANYRQNAHFLIQSSVSSVRDRFYQGFSCDYVLTIFLYIQNIFSNL